MNSSLTRTPRRSVRRPLLTAGLAATALLLSACASGSTPGGGTATGSASPTGSTSPTGSASSSPRSTERTEVASVTPRVVLSHDGGLVTLDAESGEVVHEQEREGFLRLNNAGDGQHVMVSAGDEFLSLIHI